jgi:hypothetical protein
MEPIKLTEEGLEKLVAYKEKVQELLKNLETSKL